MSWAALVGSRRSSRSAAALARLGRKKPVQVLSASPCLWLEAADSAEVVGSDFVHSYGGEVLVLSFLDDCSTSAIVTRIRQQSA